MEMETDNRRESPDITLTQAQTLGWELEVVGVRGQGLACPF